MAKQSRAAMSLCMWARAMDVYSRCALVSVYLGWMMWVWWMHRHGCACWLERAGRQLLGEGGSQRGTG